MYSRSIPLLLLLLLLAVRDKCHTTASNARSCPIPPHHNMYITAVYAEQKKEEGHVRKHARRLQCKGV